MGLWPTFKLFFILVFYCFKRLSVFLLIVVCVYFVRHLLNILIGLETHATRASYPANERAKVSGDLPNRCNRCGLRDFSRAWHQFYIFPRLGLVKGDWFVSDGLCAFSLLYIYNLWKTAQSYCHLPLVHFSI